MSVLLYPEVVNDNPIQAAYGVNICRGFEVEMQIVQNDAALTPMTGWYFSTTL